MKKIKKILTLLFFLLLPQVAGFLGAIFTFSAIESWYQYLKKPSFAPPNFLFGPVWTLLYFLIGIASFFIWKNKENPKAKTLLKVYFIHLILNTLWSFLFFGLKNPFLAFLEIIILWFFVAYLALTFYKIKKASGIIFVIYLFWISFAMILNFSILILN